MEEKLKRILEWEKGNPQGPVDLQINPTDKCNLSCRFCWLRDSSRVNYNNEISDERYMKLIDEAKELKVNHITITGGGEPTIRKDLVLGMVEKIKSSSMAGTMITNGTLFDQESIQRIVEIGWDEIIFSLDSPDAATHEYLRGKNGCFEKTVEAIKTFSNHKKTLQSTNPKICVHYVLTNKNYDQIVDMVEFITTLGAENFFVEPLVNLSFDTDMGEELKITDESQVKTALKQIRKSHKLCCKNGIENNLEFLGKGLLTKVNRMQEVIVGKKEESFGPMQSTLCFEPFTNMIIRPAGGVGPCCMFEYTGEYLHDKSLKEIWFGENFQEARDKLKRGELLNYCNQCNPGQVIGNKRVREKLQEACKEFPS